MFPRRHHPLLAPLLPSVLALLALSIAYLSGIGRVSFHLDESEWLNSSDVYEAVMDFDFSGPAWHDGYYNRVQPSVPRFVMGLGRSLGGHPFDMIYMGNWQKVIVEKIRPSPDVLWWARFPMAVLAVASGFLIFGLVRRVGGNGSAAIVVLFFCATPFFRDELRRSMGESCVLFFAMLSMVCGVKAVSGVPGMPLFRGRLALNWWWLLASAAFAGFAAASKLNGISLVGGAWLLALFALWTDFRSGQSRGRAVAVFLLRVLVTGMVAVGVFYILNPFYWPDPSGRWNAVIAHRIDTVRLQQYGYPNDAIYPGTRFFDLSRNFFGRWELLAFPGAGFVNAFLFVVGALHCVRLTLTDARLDRSAGAAGLIAFGAAAISPSLASPLSWSRYFLFPVLFTTIFTALVLGIVADRVRGR